MMGSLRILPALFEPKPRIAQVHLTFTPPRYAPVCVVCRRGWGRHRRFTVVTCERCGSQFADKCYWKKVATTAEALVFSVGTDAELAGQLMLCATCRS